MGGLEGAYVKRRVEYAGRTYEIDEDWNIYRIVIRRTAAGRTSEQRIRDDREHIRRGVTAAFLQQRDERSERARRRRALIRAAAREKPAPKEPEPRPSRLRRALGYPIRWLRAWLRAREIEPEAGVRAWCRRATRWARTD